MFLKNILESLAISKVLVEGGDQEGKEKDKWWREVWAFLKTILESLAICKVLVEAEY